MDTPFLVKFLIKIFNIPNRTPYTYPTYIQPLIPFFILSHRLTVTILPFPQFNGSIPLLQSRNFARRGGRGITFPQILGGKYNLAPR